MNNIEKTMKLMTNGMTISKALAEVYKTRKVQIPFKEEELNISVNEVGLSNRAMNCFAKEHLSTLLDVINYLDKTHWNKIRGFGKGTALETYEKILDVAWSKLNTKERAEFLMRVDEENEAKEI